MELTKGQLDVMNTEGHVLITGGPGSGKTTISILKAAQIVDGYLRPGQKVLFLSFARATISRVVEAIEYEQRIPPAQKRLIDVETYHSFFWRILKSHGYLLGLPRRLTILTPPGESIALSELRSDFPRKNLTAEQKAARSVALEAERRRLATSRGQVCFDLFAPYVGDILQGSERIRRLVAAMYPVIVLDEFQDTNREQWRVVQALGASCRLIALADPEQRIYDFIGADPARLDHFRESFEETEVDLSTDNHRSTGTEIANFGNDLLTGNFRQAAYVGISVDTFDPYPGPAMTKLVTTTYAARQRLIRQYVENWSLAILVPTRKMTRMVSEAFRQPPAGMTAITHLAIIEMDAAILSAEVISFLMQPAADYRHFAKFINLMCNYFQGKGGDAPTKSALKEAADMRTAYAKWQQNQSTGRNPPKNSILVNMMDVYEQTRVLTRTGNPEEDWRTVRNVLENGQCARLNEVAREAKNIHILGRGTQLRQALSQDWRESGCYFNALSITQQAFMQEHFATSTKPEVGVVVMNMHKAKGKQFDEVIIFEGWPIQQRGKQPYNADRIVRENSKSHVSDQARQNLRVSITRAKRQTTILTPRGDPCVLLATDK